MLPRFLCLIYDALAPTPISMPTCSLLPNSYDCAYLVTMRCVSSKQAINFLIITMGSTSLANKALNYGEIRYTTFHNSESDGQNVVSYLCLRILHRVQYLYIHVPYCLLITPSTHKLSLFLHGFSCMGSVCL